MRPQDTHHPGGDVRFQIEFARHVYDNQQAIIRQIDTKAAVFVTLLVFLAAGTLPLAKDVCAKLQWTGRGATTSWIYVASASALVIGFFATVICVQNVIRARGSEHRNLSSGLMFAFDVLRKENPEEYHEAVKLAAEEMQLKNLTGEIYQLARIVQRKTLALRFATWPTIITFLAWAMNVLLSIYILTWR